VRAWSAILFPAAGCYGAWLPIGLFLAVLIAFPGIGFSKPKPTPGIVPTVVKPMEFRIPVGGELQVLLAAAGHREGTTYELRSQPGLGFLAPVRLTSDGRGLLRYKHEPDKGPGRDSFFYRAQNPGCTPSVKEAISIEIYQPPAELECSLGEFLSAPVGGSSNAALDLRNTGGSRYSGRLKVSPPWRAEKDEVDLDPGESASFDIGFFPEKDGAHYGTLHLVGEPSKSFRLQAEGTAPFQSTPARLRLAGNGTGKRSALLRLSNTSDQKLELEFTTPPTLLPVPPLAIEPGKHAEVEIQADPAQPGGSSDRLEIVKDFFKVPVRFEVEALPARLEFTPGRDLVFPPCAEGDSSTLELGIANLGGQECRLTLKPPNWIRAGRPSVSVGPGQRVSISLTAVPSGNGTFREPIVLESCTGQIEPLMASVTILEQHREEKASKPLAPDSPMLVDGRRIAREALRIHSISTEGGKVRILWSDPLPGKFAYRFHWLEITSFSALALENSPISEAGTEKFSPEKFAAERLNFKKNLVLPSSEDRVVKRWRLIRNAQTRLNENATHELIFTAPKDRFSLRVKISRILPDGSSSPTSMEIHIPLLPEKSNGFPWRLVSFAMLLILALLLLWYIRRPTFIFRTP